MKFILHDWSDSDSLKILEQIRQAMKPGYSALVIEEFILPQKDCPMLSAMWDWEMMVFLNSLERSEGHWRRLLDETGFDAKFFYPPGDGQVCYTFEPGVDLLICTGYYHGRAETVNTHICAGNSVYCV